MDARETTLALIDTRSEQATVCPSEVARAVARETGTEWRSLMPDVHAAIDILVSDKRVRLSWKGQQLNARTGPYRIRRRQSDGH